MTIENLKQLQQLINLCHKNNIMNIEVDGIKIELGTKPIKQQRSLPKVPMTAKEYAEEIVTQELTPEQLLYYSSNQEAQ